MRRSPSSRLAAARTLQRARGFTLIEIMVVVVIIGVLSAGMILSVSLTGRDRELENTEKLMNSIRLWNMRFDANCEEILRRPSAA